MSIDLSLGGNRGNGHAKPHVSESSTAGFAADVIEASKTQPVLVDFWAPWCGPCRQLTPALEKLAGDSGGTLKLVKINVDENQALAGQMGIQSIPAVIAFVDGRPVDGFMGAIPESELRQFAARLPQPAGGAAQPAGDNGQIDLDKMLDTADEALVANDMGTAAQIYGQIAQLDPENARALLGLARLHVAAGNMDQAREMFALIPDSGAEIEGYEVLKKTLLMAEEAEGLGASAELARTVEAKPDDLQARFDLAMALNAEGDHEGAADQLCEIFRRDREWNEQAARTKLLELFEVWGPKDPATSRGRRKLSSLMFS